MATKTTTAYTVFVNDEALEGKPVAKKAKAVELAEAAAKSDKRANVQVRTAAGNVVHDIKGRKTIKMSRPYTRVVNLPDDAVIPDGVRVAYTRNRKGLAIVHDFGMEDGPYQVVNFVTGAVLASELETTRDAGAFCKTVKVPAKA
jgi:hypothetical protein